MSKEHDWDKEKLARPPWRAECRVCGYSQYGAMPVPDGLAVCPGKKSGWPKRLRLLFSHE